MISELAHNCYHEIFLHTICSIQMYHISILITLNHIIKLIDCQNRSDEVGDFLCISRPTNCER